MARIPEEEIERIKREVSLERLVEASGVELKKRGKDLFGRCPFHAPDETPSFSVTPAKRPLLSAEMVSSRKWISFTAEPT